MRPHVLGIDDGPFDVHDGGATPIVGVMTEGADRVEAECPLVSPHANERRAH
jgi:endonuclease V-like protein UPF0215 family